MNKIVVVSMVKNEEDIIESFVRHCLSFADEMIVVDHNSSDGTGKILASLQDEGLPLHLHRYMKVELAHAEVMNELLHEAIEKYGADLILPADADEFLLSFDDTCSCREVLQKLDINYVYLLHWWKCEPAYPEQDQDQFILSRPCYREAKFSSAQKTLIGAGIAENRPFVRGKKWKLCLVQGCHYAYWQSSDGEKTDLREQKYSNVLRVAHFHWRSDIQYMSKIAVSWINNVAKYSMNTVVAGYLKSYFDKIGKGERVCPTDFLQEKVSFDLRQYCVDQPLKYGAYIQRNVLRNLMAASEAMAESYVEEKLLKKKIVVSVILPYWGDIAALKDTLACVASETYPYLDIIVCSCKETVLEEPKSSMDSYQGNGNIRYFCAKENTAQRVASLGEYVKGSYVQWLLPGQQLAANKIWKMLACIENFDYAAMECIMACGRQNENMPSLYLDFCLVADMEAKKGNIFMYLLQGCLPIAGGISAAIFHRGLMERCSWCADAFVGDRLFEMSLWEKVFSHIDDKCVGILKESLSSWRDPGFALENMIWYQFEVELFMQKYHSEMINVHKIKKVREEIRDLAVHESLAEDLLLEFEALL